MKTRYSSTGQSWGLLVSLDLFGCTPAKINSGKAIEKYVVTLCDKVINMKRYGPCHLELFGEKGTPLAGYSMFQFIETSCISGHFSESDHSAYIDVFSCADFDPVAVKKFTMEYFGARDCNVTIVPRMYDEKAQAKPVAGKVAKKPVVVAKKAVARKAVAKKAVAKKAVAKKAVAKKAPARKPASVVVKATKSASIKAVAKKAIAKKPRA